MSPENTKYLVEKYPSMFKPDFHFECSDGWFDLLKTLCGCIQNHIDWKNQSVEYTAMNCGTTIEEEKANVPYVEAAQIKEKFGSLRAYFHGKPDDSIMGMIDMAEAMSYNVCEGCGNRGKQYSLSWVRTHCESCENKWQEKRKERL